MGLWNLGCFECVCMCHHSIQEICKKNHVIAFEVHVYQDDLVQMADIATISVYFVPELQTCVHTDDEAHCKYNRY